MISGRLAGKTRGAKGVGWQPNGERKGNRGANNTGVSCGS